MEPRKKRATLNGIAKKLALNGIIKTAGYLNEIIQKRDTPKEITENRLP